MLAGIILMIPIVFSMFAVNETYYTIWMGIVSSPVWLTMLGIL